MLYDIPVLSELNPPKMASSSSAVNESVILTEDDIPGVSLAGLKAGFHIIADDRRRSRIADRRSQTIAKRAVSI